MSSSLSDNSTSHTCICIHFLVGCKRKDCSFAHSKTQIKARLCKFNLRCSKKKMCIYHHSNDKEPTKDDLWKRGIDQHIKYTFENNQLTMLENKVVGFNPKSIQDINDVYIDNFSIHEKVIIEPEVVTPLMEIEHEKYEPTELFEKMKELELNDKIEYNYIPQIRKRIFFQLDIEVSTTEDYVKICDYIRSLGGNPIVKSIC